MKHMAVYFNTRHGKAGIVMSGETFDKIEHSLDKTTRAYKSEDIGLVGYLGCDSFSEAIDNAMKWETKREG